MRDKLFVLVIALVFLGFALVFCTFPRSTWSDVERRELMTFPKFSFRNLADGKFTSEVSTWFSDSEPYRDKFMAMNMWLKSAEAIQLGTAEESVVVTPAQTGRAKADVVDNGTWETFSEYLVVGSAPTARALATFHGRPEDAKPFADVINLYYEVLGPEVTIYCMAIPTAVEFYCPASVREMNEPQLPVIQAIYAQLNDSIRTVDVYSALQAHVDEKIYHRTDHHWTPLAGYYAACAFADVAGVKSPMLEDYQQHIRLGFMGSMYGKVQSQALKESPEDFIYYTPRREYSAHYTSYKIDDEYELASDEETYHEGPFFVEQHLARRGAAYSVFMGGNNSIVRVECNGPTQRRLLIVKDSYGNTLPSFLFGSFAEVHVIDYRFFPHCLLDYVRDNQITDLLFANNVPILCITVPSAYQKMLVKK